MNKKSPQSMGSITPSSVGPFGSVGFGILFYRIRDLIVEHSFYWLLLLKTLAE
ncbi:MAG: hypothetical protein JNJ41_11770 [Bacteroidia bacterium]|nr:hypothetical protein [Bacteroidia bacterium]